MVVFIAVSIVALVGPPSSKTIPKEVKQNTKTTDAAAANAGTNRGRVIFLKMCSDFLKMCSDFGRKIFVHSDLGSAKKVIGSLLYNMKILF